jgi:hypothetical protein
MFPPVYTTLRANATVLATVADRIGPHGTVAQTETRPYITWQVVLGQPHDNLSDPPPSDFTSLQIDCYHANALAVVTLASAVRDALDAAWVVNRTIINIRDFDTKLYRVGLEADFITQRTP